MGREERDGVVEIEVKLGMRTWIGVGDGNGERVRLRTETGMEGQGYGCGGVEAGYGQRDGVRGKGWEWINWKDQNYSGTFERCF